MLEVNAIHFVLLLEGFGLLALVLCLWMIFSILRLRRNRRIVGDLARRIKSNAAQRLTETETFLQLAYQLEADELQQSLREINDNENEFLSLLVNSLGRRNGAQIAKLDAAYERLAKSYKCLQPRRDASSPTEVRAEIVALQDENKDLKSELSVAKDKMSGMISEFGNMFGGGKGHELEIDEIKERLAAIQAENEIDIKLEPQK